MSQPESFIIELDMSDYSGGTLDRMNLAMQIFELLVEGVPEDPQGNWSIDGVDVPQQSVRPPAPEPDRTSTIVEVP